MYLPCYPKRCSEGNFSTFGWVTLRAMLARLSPHTRALHVSFVVFNANHQTWVWNRREGSARAPFVIELSFMFTWIAIDPLQSE